MKVTRLLSATLLASSGIVSAQPTDSPCDVTEYRQFDFWLGDFEVRTAEGGLAGYNLIEPILGGCAITEQWTGVGGGRGRSVNFYDRSDGQWHQVWIDDRGQPLYLSGGFDGTSMILRGETRDTAGKTTLQRITWTPRPDGRVRQHWESSADMATNWSTVFDGYYVRRP